MALFEKALAFAAEKHSGSKRKLDFAPYMLHPIEAALIVSSMTSDDEILSAAVLHDTVEDTDATLEEIEALFGLRVASLVASETENKRPGISKSESWRVRKEESLAELANTTDIGVKYIWLGDKLSNLRGMHRAFLKDGLGFLNSFNQKDPTQHAWYYRSIRALLAELCEFEAWREFSNLIDEMFGEDVPNEV